MSQDRDTEQLYELQALLSTLDLKPIFLALGWEALPLTSPNSKRMGRSRVSAKFQAVDFSPGSSLIGTLLVISYGDPHTGVPTHGHM